MRSSTTKTKKGYVDINVLSEGESGRVFPKRGSKVAVHYDGFLADGTLFDSSKKRGRPLTFVVGAQQIIEGKISSQRESVRGRKLVSKRTRARMFIVSYRRACSYPGLDEGVSKISVGTRAKITIPPEKAYGKKGFPGLVPPNSTLIFDVVLLSCK